MKKTMQFLLILLPFILFSCFEFVGTGSTRQLLNLALAAPGDVAKIHVAVFDGALTQDRVIYNTTFAAGSSIPLDLPAGDNRFIVVWAEGFSGTGNYFGSIGPVTIQDSGNTPLPVQMQRFNTSQYDNAFNMQNTSGSEYTWNAIPGAITYSLDYTNGESQTTGATAIVPSDYSGYIRVLTSVFDIPSDEVYFNLG